MVQVQEHELIVGDVLHFGNVTVTVIDIDQDEVTFRIDDGDTHASVPNGFAAPASGPLPR